jgi:regulatory protein
VSILTALAPDPSQPGYRLVDVDRGRFASLPADALDALQLAVGAELSAARLAHLQYLADVEAAYRAAVRALAARARARGDLRRRLVQKQHPPQAVDGALARLTDQGLLDDRRFALHHAGRRAAGGKGPARLVADLVVQGVDRRIAETAVRDALAEENIDPAAMLRAVATRRAAQLADLPRPVRKRRLLAYLARRGYPGAAVRDLVDEVLSDREEGSGKGAS